MARPSGSNEIRLTRVYEAPVCTVWAAWTDPAQVAQWWGPRGFTLTTHHKDLRPGGSWRYTMHGPDGTDYPNIATYHVVEPQRRLVYDHGATDDSPPLFQVTVTFAEAQGRTTMELVMRLPSPEAAAQTERLIQRAGGNATWDRLAEHLEEATSGRRCFVIHRTLDAPIERVFQMWCTPEHLLRWLPPAGTTMRFLRGDIAVGRSTFFVISGPGGDMHVRAEYLAIEPPHLIAYTQQFVDAQEQPAAAPGTEAWPATLLNTVRFTEEAPGRTRVMLSTQAHGAASPAQVEAFVRERPGMTAGWSGSFDVLEALLVPRLDERA